MVDKDGSGGEGGKSKDGRRAMYKYKEGSMVGVEARGWARLPKEQ